jgi:hypothetical protein
MMAGTFECQEKTSTSFNYLRKARLEDVQISMMETWWVNDLNV